MKNKGHENGALPRSVCHSGAEAVTLFMNIVHRLYGLVSILLFLITISSAIIGVKGAYASYPSTPIASLTVGSGPYGISGNGTYAVVAESLTGKIDIINLSNFTLLNTSIYAGTNPSMVAVTPNGEFAYITGYGNSGSNSSVYAVSLNNTTNFTTSTISVGSGPIGINIADNQVFVTNYSSNSWSYFPVGSASASTVDSWGGGPLAIAANASGTNVYVANSSSNTVTVFQYNYNVTNTYGIMTTVTTGAYTNAFAYPDALVLVPNSTTLYVANAANNTVSVINTSTNSVSQIIALPTGGRPNGLVLSPDNSTLMVLNSPSGGITYIQVSSNTIINSSSFSSNPNPPNIEQAYITSNGPNAYVTDYANNVVYLLANIVNILSTTPSAINDSNNNVSTITWSSTMSGTYEVEIGGNGVMGSGTPIPGDSGAVTAGQQMTTTIYASDLINLAGGANGPYTIYIYVKTSSVTAYGVTSIILLTVPPQPATNLTATPNDSKAFLNWTASTSNYVGGYEVYFSASPFDIYSLPSTQEDAGNVVSYTLGGLVDGTPYAIGLVTYDQAGNTSGLSNTVTVIPVHIPSPSDLAGQKGNCFIATAAYGSYDDFDVWVLRQFRNKILLKSDAGRWFVKTYYELSPPLAHFIAGHDALRAIIRVLLKPFVFGSMVVLYGTLLLKLSVLIASIMVIILIFVVMVRRHTYA